MKTFNQNLTKEISLDKSLNLPVTAKIRNQHPLITKVLASLNMKSNNIYEGLVRLGPGTIDVNCGPSSMLKALRVMDTVFKVLEQRGYSIRIYQGETLVAMHGAEVPIRIYDIRKQGPPSREWRRYELHPTGILKIQYDQTFCRKEIIQGKTMNIEQMIPRIIAVLEVHALKEAKERRERDAYWEKYHREQEVKKLAEEKKKLEEEKFNQLVEDAMMWKKMKVVRSYLRYMGRKADCNQEWLEWAKRIIDIKEDSLQ